MRLSRLFRFFWDAAAYTSADPSAIEAVGEEGARHRTYHRRVVLLGALFGLAGLILGIPVVNELRREAEGDLSGPHATEALLAAPLLTGIAGTCFGVALACLCAPRSFLEGPVGQKWLGLIGTTNVGAARIVCLVVSLALAAGLIGIGVFLYLHR